MGALVGFTIANTYYTGHPRWHSALTLLTVSGTGSAYLQHILMVAFYMAGTWLCSMARIKFITPGFKSRDFHQGLGFPFSLVVSVMGVEREGVRGD